MATPPAPIHGRVTNNAVDAGAAGHQCLPHSNYHRCGGVPRRDEELIVEAMVLNKDIGFVREGQDAEVKLEAFPFTRYGVIKGTIERISTDSVENEELGLVFP